MEKSSLENFPRLNLFPGCVFRVLTRLLCIGLFGFAMLACDENYTFKAQGVPAVPYDPNKPVEVTAILPDSGGYNTPFIIKGSNFGSDLSKIKVIFNGNREANIVSTSGDMLYGIVPKQADGQNEVTVMVNDEKEATLPQTFRYTKVEQISTLAGKHGTGAYVDGVLSESRFQYMVGINVVAGGNVIVCEDRQKRVRMISEADNKVTTLQSGVAFGHPAVTKDRKIAYCIQKEKPHAVYIFSQLNAWQPKRLVSSIQDFNGEIWSCTLDDEEQKLYFRDHEGKMGYLLLDSPEDVTVLNAQCGAVDKKTSYLIWSSMDKCFFLSVQNAQGIYKVSHDGKTVEEYAGFNGIGNMDGPRMSMSMKNPTGMAFDKDGNMYFTDSMGFTVRRINREDGMATTVAGIFQSEGGDDGLPLESKFSYPYDISVDDDGNFYICQGWGCSVRKFAIE